MKQLFFLSLRTSIAFFTILSLSSFYLADSSQETSKKRAQDPQEPYPYTSVDVEFYNATDSVKLAGTFTIPSGKGPYPAVILVSGSGLQNRNEELMNHRPFLVLSDYLTRNGIAVLRYDDRGVGGSEKGSISPTTEHFARDAEAALAFLRTQKGINKKKIGVIGHSEGGTIAFILAARNPKVNFIVSLAGSTVRGDLILLSQLEASLALTTYHKEFKDKMIANNREVFEYIIASESNDSTLKSQVESVLLKYRPLLKEKELETLSKSFLNDWLYYFIKYDPQPQIKSVKVPVLALNGKKDVQVISSLNLPELERCLKEGGNKHYQILEMDGLNHLFQECTTGATSEYYTIEQTISPNVLESIKNWIQSL